MVGERAVRRVGLAAITGLRLLIIAKAVSLAGVIFVAAGIALTGYEGDAWIYWRASHLPADLYGGTWNADAFSYVYPPAFAQLLAPFGLLPYPLFFALWVALETAALVWLAGPLLAFAAILVYEPFQHELLTGNVNLILAVAVVLAVRAGARSFAASPASESRSESVRRWLPNLAWSFVLLSKVTPGVGLLYHALRREWRPLGVGIGVTAAITATSFLLAPSLWAEWAARMSANLSQAANPDELLPLSVRLLVAVAVVAVGAWKGWRWTIVLAAGIALPNFVPMNLAYFVALVPFLADRIRADRVPPGRVVAGVDRP